LMSFARTTSAENLAICRIRIMEERSE
jgi:hypothetical protein